MANGRKKRKREVKDIKDYIANHRNATAASFKISGSGGSMEIQVTICAVPPPLVSHVCVYCPSHNHNIFTCEPSIVATNDNLLLLLVLLGPRKAGSMASRNNYYLYQAGNKPKL
ncbi:hypothetical protein E2562_028230 [Oryza meyeriana var. granulata]|uniref:Uncharacterized protein n=1 Tax=Oryza meyeriana var. granulata TaxID=110450 RepID=A0A6G1DPN2_9ORYZ|nr:hypothetical protein E2562_028230 [Oryza meyeriana var. granulata]